MLSGVSKEIVGGNEELLLLFPIVCQLLRIRELQANCRALEVEVWLVQMMCGKWIGGMIFLLVGMFTNVLGLGPSAWRLRERLQNKFEEILLHSFRMREKGWQTIKKAEVYAFLEQLAQFYEIIVYSDYSYMHVDPVMPVMERLDTKHCVTYNLGKAATMYQIAEETYTTQIAALETAMSTPVFVQGSLNSVCNRYQLLIWAVVYTANEDLESITDTQTELQLMELDAHNFVKFKVQNSHYPNGSLQKESKFFFLTLRTRPFKRSPFLRLHDAGKLFWPRQLQMNVKLSSSVSKALNCSPCGLVRVKPMFKKSYTRLVHLLNCKIGSICLSI
ncbi:hypothetical protein PS1_034866 [Malus domestica]